MGTLRPGFEENENQGVSEIYQGGSAKKFIYLSDIISACVCIKK